MSWFNIYGLVIMVLIMIPNIIFAVKCKDGFVNYWHNRFIETFEQIGRFSCFGLMVINIPKTWFGLIADNLIIYISVNAILVVAYLIIWFVCFKKNSIFRALALSILPSLVFLFSGIMLRYVFLIIAAMIFAPCHIILSYKNASKELKLNNH